MTNDEGQRIKENGWRQGSILDKCLIKDLVSNKLLPEYCDDGIWFVLSHDCDVTSYSFDKEPNVEVIFGKTIKDANQKDGNNYWGKNSRLLQIEFNHLLYEFNANSRFVLPRKHLAIHSPAKFSITDEKIWQVVCWIALRYNRRSFPDEFNSRIKKATKSIRKKLKADGALLSGVFILVSSNELGETEDYEIILWATMTVADHDDQNKRKKGNLLLGIIETEFSECKGIDVVSAELRSETDMGLDALRAMKRWDYCNDLTLRQEDQESIVPNS